MAATGGGSGGFKLDETAMPYRQALALLSTLFFMWGFITVINNTLDPSPYLGFELNAKILGKSEIPMCQP